MADLELHGWDLDDHRQSCQDDEGETTAKIGPGYRFRVKTRGVPNRTEMSLF
jgi:hypothetical protein